jgi:hypothetical protein
MILKLAMRRRHHVRAVLSAAVALAVFLLVAPAAQAQIKLNQISKDTFTNSSSQHATEVEPDTFSFGSTIVATFQMGRFGPQGGGGGASDNGFATSTDGGSTWTHGVLPGLTNIQHKGNPYDRVSDPTVAYDPKHDVWLIASLPIVDSGSAIPAVAVNRSTDGGKTWSKPVSVTGNVDSSDKSWIVCDTWSGSPYYGNCYVEWDDPYQGDLIYMNTSTDGGKTWGSSLNTADGAYGVGGQPVVQPNGTVVVPIEGYYGQIAFTSTNGGSSWNSSVSIANINDHEEAGGLRSGPLPSAAVDGAGKVYVVWQDCSFRSGCAENDIVMSTSTDGSSWSTVARIPIDPKSSTVDHFIPGIDADKSTSGKTAHLALTYYFYPKSNCDVDTCRLGVGYVSSTDGGASWTAAKTLASGMHLSWLPNSQNGLMVADYISTSYVNGKAFGVFAVAQAPTGSKFRQAMYTTASGLEAPEGGVRFSSAGDQPVPNAKSDHPRRLEEGEQGGHKPPSAKLARKAARQ